ncbi:Indolepyruvate oxidoreductase subunit IorB [Metallosphaera sp. J1]|uniref:indolepyruvate oxidoreductase subunit beta n=1 Tax=Metallosphaera javensis (ex Hofmann et al. 2022) TaxID=99938 RepID=UPI001EE07089|nr:indolepyruvate oxidoreductase subunit beta [Metallosphaera javensis (ex Hofmann et al. 2022)]MCG3108062.1 Indolepyruvate oxidoreductase subunit IorB [Metallosphaera javensis (ex Hofmann et al. 2022)]
MDKLSVLIAGIGGQGVVTAGRIIAEAFGNKGYRVFEAETHGLSQRGGAVNVHVRIGNVEAPLIPRGGADIMIALEATEALRNIEYLSKSGEIFLNASVKPPSLPKVQEHDAEQILGRLKDWKVYVLDCNKITGNAGKCNTALLGIVYQARFSEYLEEEDFLSLLRDQNNRNSFLAGVRYWERVKEQGLAVQK